ncbi:3'-5' exoribonuclease YhaM [Fundidesulfovibrio magnetotacticus]|uniref:3'-5' exoribonuclease YhaM n=1 Tax=Fundidesulfovibrio magnetotacticus TaxID=2730080 RepID=A0A6V8M155_9BACT|nr:HD domain-containing protein [Fundidesulfovibrio magnetotacticus]GFK95587.1 3'-5' exoribonuclease YhaM [Fundidesulfovibrio magnetotacticus]
MTDKRIFVRDLSVGLQVNECFLVAQASKGQARNGPFWSLKLQDASGAIDAKLWSPGAQAFDDIQAGQFALVAGAVTAYRDQPQINLDGLTLLGTAPEGVDHGDFLPESAEKPESLYAKLEELLSANIGHAPWRRFCKKVLTDPEIRAKLLAAPGAKAMHHAYRGGLVEHTLAVCRVVLALCQLYPDLDRDTLLAAAAFHDMGKAWELSSGLTRDYTDEGQMLGHIVLGMGILEPFLRKARDLDPGLVLHFRHMLISHHGELAYGSPRSPMTPEAMLLHFADNIDAKVHQFQAAVDDPEKIGVTSFVRGLDRYVFNPARVRPEAPQPRKPEQGPSQCSLPLKA